MRLNAFAGFFTVDKSRRALTRRHRPAKQFPGLFRYRGGLHVDASFGGRLRPGGCPGRDRLPQFQSVILPACRWLSHLALRAGDRGGAGDGGCGRSQCSAAAGAYADLYSADDLQRQVLRRAETNRRTADAT